MIKVGMLPEIFTIGSFSVSGYAFFYTLGFLAGGGVLLILAKKENLDLIEVLSYFIFFVVSTVLGSKLYGVIYVILKNPSFPVTDLSRLWNEFKSGGVFYGGMIAGLIYAYFYISRYFGGKEWQVADISMVAVALGHMFGRIGCFCAGCCYGKSTQLPWGVVFPSLAGRPHPTGGSVVHPTQIYEAVLDLLNFLILLFVWRKRKFTGQVFALYFINYGIIRFVVEIFRNDGGRGYVFDGHNQFFSLSFPQFISILLIISGVILYLKRREKNSP